MRKPSVSPLSIAAIALPLTIGCATKSSGSSDTTAEPSPPPQAAVNEGAPEGTEQSRNGDDGDSAAKPGAASVASTHALPALSDDDAGFIRIEATRWGVKIDGRDWLKKQPASVRSGLKTQGLADKFKSRALSRFRTISKKFVAMHSVGNRVWTPMLKALAELLDAQGSNAVSTVRLRVNEQVPFWFAEYTANMIFWEDRITHIELEVGKQRIRISKAVGSRESVCEASGGNLCHRPGLTVTPRGLVVTAMAADARKPFGCERDAKWHRGVLKDGKSCTSIGRQARGTVYPGLGDTLKRVAQASAKACGGVVLNANESVKWGSVEPLLSQLLQLTPDEHIYMSNASAPADCSAATAL